MKVLVVTSLRHHLGKMRSVLEELRERGCEIQLVTAQNSVWLPGGDFEAALRGCGFCYRRLAELRLHPEFHARLRPRLRALAAGLAERFGSGERPPGYTSDADLGYSLLESVEDHVLFQLLFEEERPDAALALHENGFWSRNFAVVCAEQGVPFFTFQEGPSYDIFTPTLLSEYGYYADRTFLWGESERRRLLGAGVRDEQLRVVGPAYLDALVASRPSRAEARAKLGLEIPDGAGLVVFAPANPGNVPVSRTFHEALLRFVASRPALHLCLKWWPGGRFPVMETLDERSRDVLGPRYASFWKESAYDVLFAADCVIGHASTLAGEAVALGVPFLELAWEGSETDPIAGLSRHAGAEKLTGPADLPRVEEYARGRVPVLVQAYTRAYRLDFFDGIRGDSTRRTCDEILGLLAARRDAA